MNQNVIWDYYQNEAPESFSGSVARLTFLAKKVKSKKRVLNIGIGAGNFEQAAIRLGLDVYSLDPNEKSVVFLRQRFGVGEKAKVGYSQKIPFVNLFFDAVVISEVIEHLSDEVIENTLSEISRVLMPGGQIIGTVPAREKTSEQLAICPNCAKHFHRWGHVQTFDSNRIQTLLAKYFKVEEVFERPFITWSTLNWKGKATALLKILLYFPGIHGSNENIVFIANKPCV